MDEQNSTTAAQDRHIEQGDTDGREPAAADRSGGARDSERPGTEQPHEEDRMESEGGPA